MLSVVTSGQLGGAQTFVRQLVEGLGSSYEFHVAAGADGDDMARSCAEAGAPFHVLEHMRRDISALHDVLAVRELRRLIERVRPHLIQLNSSKSGAVGRIAAVGTRVPIVFTAHGWAFSTTERGAHLYAVVERMLAPLASAIVCVSAADRARALANHVGKPSRLHVIHNGVEALPHPFARGAWPDRPRLACVARLSPPKDVPLLLRALARPGLEPWTLDIIGDGPLRAAVEEAVAALGLDERVRLLGDRRDVVPYLLGSDALVLPSRWEGFPYAILEAMAVALPVVASDVGGVSEAVRHRETGLLVPHGDENALARALHELLTNGDWARSLGLAGHALVTRRFTVESMLHRYDALFRSVLDRL